MSEPIRTIEFSPQTLSLSESVELRLTPFVTGRARVRSVELRLYRKADIPGAGAAFLPTSAGFLVPVNEVRNLGALLFEWADRLGALR